jgi:formylglycine-generating enzyme required for sulfatase activity
MRPVFLLLVGIVWTLAPAAHAGPWSQLPDAIDRLVERPGDEDAERVLRLAEASILRQAQQGRVGVTRSLFDTYASLVPNLPDGITRLSSIERRIADQLLKVGDQERPKDLLRASALWALAAELDPESEAVVRLRTVLLPPVNARPGQVWKAPLDGAKLIFHPAASVRIGCTVDDNACLNNELVTRDVEVPALWVEAHEVSNRRYRLCVVAGGCSPPEVPSEFNDLDRVDDPVVGVSWRQARAYALWSSRRLPSEAEWERAARGEINTMRFPWGNARRRELANLWLEPRSAITGGTRPVGSFPSMGYGTADMAGNVWEWCQDRYLPRLSELPADGSAARQGLGRVVRGGSWRRAVDMARVSTRSWFDVGYFADDLGFRCVVDHNRAASVGDLVRAAQRAFPIDVATGRDFDGSDLEAEDRRYLERRTITLFVIEGRMEEALIPAAHRLNSDPGDPVAGDLFTRLETELLNEASGNGIADLEDRLDAYRSVAVENPRVASRFVSLQRQLLVVLRQAVTEHERRGDRETAQMAAKLGLKVAPNDAVFAAAVSRLTRKTGTTRVWPEDGKGMVWIEGRRLHIGASPGDLGASSNEHPEHEVTLEGFWIDRTEVTNDEYRSCVRAGACTPPHRTEFFDSLNLGDHPVLWVDWFQAREYAVWVGKRLPTEAEWEAAARGGSATAFPWGPSWVTGSANAMGVYRDDVWGGTAPVASFEPNRWGLYDVIGNVSEWTEDVYNETYVGAPRDGRAWYQETGLAGERRRVVRGGGYDDPPPRQRVSWRRGRRADSDGRSVGFRCVADESGSSY